MKHKQHRSVTTIRVKAEDVADVLESDIYKTLHRIEGKALYRRGMLTMAEINEAEASDPNWTWDITFEENVLVSKMNRVIMAHCSYNLDQWIDLYESIIDANDHASGEADNPVVGHAHGILDPGLIS